MNKRVIIVLVLAVVLMAIVMAIAAMMYFSSSAPRDKWVLNRVRTISAPWAEALKVIDLTGDKNDDIMLQSTTEVLVLDNALNAVFDKNYLSVATTMGDFNGDGVDDLVIVHDQDAKGSIIAEALDLAHGGQALWRVSLPAFGKPSRATSVDIEGDKIREVVIGDMGGRLVALNSDGSSRWTYSLPTPLLRDNAYVRGLDDVTFAGGSRIIAANYNGDMVMLSAAGQPVWEWQFRSPIRRVRAYDMDGDGASEIVVGGEYGLLQCLSGNTGEVQWEHDLGKRVSEIRSANLDADPKTTEILVGMKEAGVVYGFDYAGKEATRGYLGGKVTEFTALDIDEDGKDEFLAGTEEGDLKLFRPGQAQSLAGMNLNGVARMDAGEFARDYRFAVASGDSLDIFQIEHEFAPWWYNTLTAGFVACLLIAACAFVIANLKPRPKLQYSADDMSIEGLRAKRKMLLESVADLKRSFQSGEVPSPAFEARARDLREQIAVIEAELLRLGAPFEATVMKCPSCGGSIDLGEDRCPYCGTTIV